MLKSKILQETFKIKPNQAQPLHADAQEPGALISQSFVKKQMEVRRVMTKNCFGETTMLVRQLFRNDRKRR